MSENNSFWLQLVEGIVAVALGLFLLLGRDTAVLYIGVLIAIYLLVAGIVETIRGLGLRSAGEGSALLIRGLVGLIFGAILLVMALFDVGGIVFGYTLIALALIIFGALGIYTSIFQRGDKAFEWGPVLVNLALLVWGVLIFFTRAHDRDLATISGWILVIIGAIILVWTFLTRQEEPEEPEEADAFS